MDIFWKIVVRLLGGRNRKYIKAVSMKDEIYIIDIYKFIPVNEEIFQWNNALKDSRAPD